MIGWVKCSDKMPPIDVPCFLFADNELMGIGCLADVHDGNTGWAWALNPPGYDAFGWMVDGYELDDFEPTHWMHLPTPPAK